MFGAEMANSLGEIGALKPNDGVEKVKCHK